LFVAGPVQAEELIWFETLAASMLQTVILFNDFFNAECGELNNPALQRGVKAPHIPGLSPNKHAPGILIWAEALCSKQ